MCAGRHARPDGSLGNTQVFNSVDLELPHYRHGVTSHFSFGGTRLMPVGNDESRMKFSSAAIQVPGVDLSVGERTKCGRSCLFPAELAQQAIVTLSHPEGHHVGSICTAPRGWALLAGSCLRNLWRTRPPKHRPRTGGMNLDNISALLSGLHQTCRMSGVSRLGFSSSRRKVAAGACCVAASGFLVLQAANS